MQRITNINKAVLVFGFLFLFSKPPLWANYPEPWKNQLESIIKSGGHFELLKKNNLQLLSYKKSKDDFQTVKKMEFSEKSIGVIQLNRQSIEGNFKIDELSKMPEAIPFYNKRKETIINQFEKDLNGNLLTVLDLKWSYNGNILTTQCIVYDGIEDIIYDEFLSNIIYAIFQKSSSDDTTQSSATRRVPTKELVGDSKLQGFMEFQISVYSPIGEVADAIARVAVEGMMNGTQKSITSYSTESKQSSKGGVISTQSLADIVSFKRGIDGHFEFRWAVAMGEAPNLTIITEGANRSISGGYMGQNGNHTILPSALKPYKRVYSYFDGAQCDN